MLVSLPVRVAIAKELVRRAIRLGNPVEIGTMREQRLQVRYEKHGKPTEVPLHGLTLTTLPAEMDYCYIATVRLDKGASWSELARRGLKAKGGFSSGIEVLGRTLLVKVGCANEGKDVTIRITALSRAIAGGHDFSDEVGQGTASVQYFRFGNSPFLISRADMKKNIKKETKGLRLEKSWKGRLEQPEVVALKLKKGKCYKMVFTTGADAEFSAAVKSQRTCRSTGRPPCRVRSPGACMAQEACRISAARSPPSECSSSWARCR